MTHLPVPSYILPTFRLSIHHENRRCWVVSTFWPLWLRQQCFLIFSFASSFIETGVYLSYNPLVQSGAVNHSELSCTGFCVGIHVTSLGCCLGAELPSHVSPYVYLWGSARLLSKVAASLHWVFPFFVPKEKKISSSYFAILEGWYVVKKEQNWNDLSGFRYGIIYISTFVHFLIHFSFLLDVEKMVCLHFSPPFFFLLKKYIYFLGRDGS